MNEMKMRKRKGKIDSVCAGNWAFVCLIVHMFTESSPVCLFAGSHTTLMKYWFGECTVRCYALVCMCMDICVRRGENELSCFDKTADPVLAGRMTTLIEWLPEYSNEVILPHQMMKNSCYKLVLVQMALRNFICCLIFVLASSAGTIV